MNGKLTLLTSKYIELRDKKKGLEQDVKDVNEEMDQIELELIPMMEELEAQNIKLDGIGTIYLQTRFYVKANPENMAGLVDWLDRNNMGDIAKRSVHHKTLQSEYQHWSENDMPLPPKDLVDAYPKTEVRVRKQS